MRFPVRPAAAAAQATCPKKSFSHARSALTLPVVAEARWKECRWENNEGICPPVFLVLFAVALGFNFFFFFSESFYLFSECLRRWYRLKFHSSPLSDCHQLAMRLVRSLTEWQY